MEIIIAENIGELGKKAAIQGAVLIRRAIEKNGEANIILATGASQLEMLKELLQESIDWLKVRAFHLDEYIGLMETHPASFRKYLKERVASKKPLKEFIYVNSENDPGEECKRLGSEIIKYPIDVAFIGIGENAHLAFNDPPADFEEEEAYIVVNLDDACRKQQLGEGWFPSLDEVPKTAISMSIKQILRSNAIICTVPDTRKAKAVKNAINGEITPEVPASILQTHDNTWLFLDKDSASLSQ